MLVLACAICEAFCHFVLHLGQPYNYPIFNRHDSFGDFYIYVAKFEYIHHPAFFTTGRAFMYPAPNALLFEVIYHFHPHVLRSFLGFILASFLVAGFLLGRALWRRGLPAIKAAGFITASFLLAYPLWYEFKQANTEIGTWVLIALGVWAFCKGRGYTAAACFGIAGSMKIFPFVYLGLMLAKRKYREVVFAGIVAVGTTISSLWVVGPDILDSWHGILSGLAEYRSMYLLRFRPTEISSDHSLFAVYKRFTPHFPPPEMMGHILTVYLALAALAVVALYFLRIRYLPIINQVLCFCVAYILLSPCCYDYTLMNLYVPWAMLVLFAQDQWSAKRTIPGLAAAFVCLAVLVSPETEFIYRGVGFAGQIKAGILVVLMYIALKYRFGAAESPQTGTLSDSSRGLPLIVAEENMGR